MKKIVLVTLLLALSAPAFAAPASGKGLGLANIALLHKGGLLTLPASLKGLPISLLTAGYSVTSGLPILKQTALPGLLVKLRASARNGNT